MKGFVEAKGWFFVQKSSDQEAGYPATFSRVVGWQETDDSQVVGLVSVTSTPNDEGWAVNYLAQTPPLPGTYMHWDDMTDADRQAARKQNRPGYLK